MQMFAHIVYTVLMKNFKKVSTLTLRRFGVYIKTIFSKMDYQIFFKLCKLSEKYVMIKHRVFNDISMCRFGDITWNTRKYSHERCRIHKKPYFSRSAGQIIYKLCKWLKDYTTVNLWDFEEISMWWFGDITWNTRKYFHKRYRIHKKPFFFFFRCNTHWLDSCEQATHEVNGSYWSPAVLHRVHYSRTNVLVPLLSNGSWVGGASPKTDCRNSRVLHIICVYTHSLLSHYSLHTTTSRCWGVMFGVTGIYWWRAHGLIKVLSDVTIQRRCVHVIIYIVCNCVCCDWGTLIGSVGTLSTHIHPPPRVLFSELSVVFDFVEIVVIGVVVSSLLFLRVRLNSRRGINDAEPGIEPAI